MSKRAEKIALAAPNCAFFERERWDFSPSAFFHTFQVRRFLMLSSTGVATACLVDAPLPPRAI